MFSRFKEIASTFADLDSLQEKGPDEPQQSAPAKFVSTVEVTVDSKSKASDESVQDSLIACKELISASKEKRSKLKSTFEKSKSDSLAKQEKFDELSRRMRETSAALGDDRSAMESLRATNAELQSSLEGKQRHIIDVEGKLTTLAEKFKDMMKKYAETKSKVSKLEQVEQKIEIINDLLQSKVRTTNLFNIHTCVSFITSSQESELLKIRLKSDNFERMLDDERETSSDLTAKCSELQRELARAKSSMQADALTMENMKAENAEAHLSLQVLVSEKKALLEKLEFTNASAGVAESTSAQVRRERRLMVMIVVIMMMSAQVRVELEERERELGAERDKVAEVLEQLEEYKRRAQLALKKVNHTTPPHLSAFTQPQHLFGKGQ